MQLLGGLGLVVTAGGCQILFPLEAGPEPPETPTVSGRLVEHVVVNNPDGSPAPMLNLATTAGATVHFEDRSSRAVTIEPDGSFVFERSTQNYRLELVRGADTLEVQETAAELVIGFFRHGRADATPLTGPVQLVFPSNDPGLNVLATTGQFTSTIIDNQTDRLDWRAAAPTAPAAATAPLGLLDSTALDRAYYLQYTTDALGPGQIAISKYAEIEPLAMQQGMDESYLGLALSSTSGLPDLPCVHVTGNVPDAMQAFDQALAETPGWVQTFPFWHVMAVPSTELANLGAVGLGTAPVSSLVFDGDMRVYDPFVGHELIAAMGLNASRPIAHPDNGTATKLSLSASTELIDRAARDANCVTNRVELFDSAAIAHQITLDDTALDTDARPVAIKRPGLAVVTWQDLGGRVDHYGAVLSEVVVDAANRVALEPRRRYRTRDRRLLIDGSLLVFGSHYLITISPVVGVPDVATGDYSRRTFPLSATSRPSAIFTAM